MQFTNAAVAAAILAFASAAPTAPSAYNNSTAEYVSTSSAYAPQGTGTSYTPPPPPPAEGDASVVYPGTVSQYSVWTGAVAFQVYDGKIFKDGHSSDISTLLTFSFPEASYGKSCKVAFTAPSSTGGGQFDVFTSLMPATQSTSTWPSGNLRDQHLGRMQLGADGTASLVSDVAPALVEAFPCPKGVVGMELVGAGDNVDIKWTQSKEQGISISYS
jgi:hypothetical protein